MFDRMAAWKSRYSGLGAVLFPAPLILASIVWLGVFSGGAAYADLVVSAALILPLLWWRSRPVPVFTAIACVSFAQWLASIQIMPANLAVLMALYGVASRCPPRWSIPAALVVEFGVFLGLILWENLRPSSLVLSSLFTVVAWFSGIYASTRRRYLESLEERAARAEHERDQQSRIAAAAERARIARELHDVVAHNVSVMIVQADGAGYAIDGDPESARRAVRTISATGRQALAEMRRLVGVLREDGGQEEDYAPQPGVAELDELVAQVRRSGLPVEFTVTGSDPGLPEGRQLVIYRIVQEALTNTLKHGGPGARATVEVHFGTREITLRITDDGLGAAAPQSKDGHGLIGMRERVAMYDGSVRTSPRPGGGFQVAVRLPVGNAA